MVEYYLESGEKWTPEWIELESGNLLRKHPLKLNGEVDWDIVNKEAENQIPLYLNDNWDSPYDEENNTIIWNEKRRNIKSAKGLGRNDKCFCGSNKKFKKCCLNKLR